MMLGFLSDFERCVKNISGQYSQLHSTSAFLSRYRLSAGPTTAHSLPYTSCSSFPKRSSTPPSFTYCLLMDELLILNALHCCTDQTCLGSGLPNRRSTDRSVSLMNRHRYPTAGSTPIPFIYFYIY